MPESVRRPVYFATKYIAVTRIADGVRNDIRWKLPAPAARDYLENNARQIVFFPGLVVQVFK